MNVPFCAVCNTYHQTQEPHEQTPALLAYIRRTRGREATAYDAIAHTSGLIFRASAAALLSTQPVRHV